MDIVSGGRQEVTGARQPPTSEAEATEGDGEMDALVANATVAVIGAGPSGLAAASALLLAGLRSVVVLEAADRIGGRVYSKEWGRRPGEFVEVGAQWIHGTEGNAAYEIASEMGIADDPAKGNLEEIGEEFYREDGSEVPEATVERMWYAYGRAEEYAENNDAGKEETVAEFYERAFKHAAKGRWSLMADHFKDYMHREIMVGELRHLHTQPDKVEP